MNHKALAFSDDAMAQKIMKTPDPSKCKKLGRAVAHFLPEEWDLVKEKVVEEGNMLKFSQMKD